MAYGPADVPRLRDVGVDRYVLFFTLGLATLTGILFGLAPALHASKPAPGNMLKESGRGVYTGRNRMRSALIVSEVALSLMLLAGAGLLINSFWRLLQTDAGFNPKGVLALDIPLGRDNVQNNGAACSRISTTDRANEDGSRRARCFSGEQRAVN